MNSMELSQMHRPFTGSDHTRLQPGDGKGAPTSTPGSSAENTGVFKVQALVGGSFVYEDHTPKECMGSTNCTGWVFKSIFLSRISECSMGCTSEFTPRTK